MTCNNVELSFHCSFFLPDVGFCAGVARETKAFAFRGGWEDGRREQTGKDTSRRPCNSLGSLWWECPKHESISSQSAKRSFSLKRASTAG